MPDSDTDDVTPVLTDAHTDWATSFTGIDVRAGLSAVTDTVSAVSDAVTTAAGDAMSSAADTLSSVASAVVSTAGAAADDTAGSVVAEVNTAASDVSSAIADTGAQVVATVASATSTIADTARDAAATTVTMAGTAMDAITDTADVPGAASGDATGGDSSPPIDPTSLNYQQGFQDAIAGSGENAGPRAGSAVAEYHQGFLDGTAEKKRSSDDQELDGKYRAAVRDENWPAAAESLNGFDEAGIKQRLSELDAETADRIHQGAIDNPGLGAQSKVARLTAHDHPDNDDDLNNIQAGTRFRIKMLDGFTLAGLVGVGQFVFAIWDLDNNNIASYVLTEVILAAGVPISDSGEGDWSADFQPSKPMQVDQFGGVAFLREGSAALVGLWEITIPAGAVKVTVPTFFSKSFGIDGGGGPFTYQSGSVKKFKG